MAVASPLMAIRVTRRPRPKHVVIGVVLDLPPGGDPSRNQFHSAKTQGRLAAWKHWLLGTWGVKNVLETRDFLFVVV